MTSLSAEVTLRPMRIALLVRPTDVASIRRFMRICACLWGGMYNPIIPVFRVPPSEWRPKYPERIKGYAIARGYVEFYEPDAFVEAEVGLLEEAGLGSLRDKHSLHRRVIPLEDFLRQQDHHDWSEPQIGLSILEVLRHIYEKERRFQLRDPRPAILVSPQRSTALVEAVFGAYPTQKPARYIGKGFEDVYRPEKLVPNADAWRKVFLTRAQTPLGVTRYGIEAKRSWMHDLVVFVFDPEKPTDVIDLWNLRLEPNPVLPVPVTWFVDVADDIREKLVAEHRPLQGNPNGVMHRGTVEFARSIDEPGRKAVFKQLGQMSADTLSLKPWRTPIWDRYTDDHVHRHARLEVSAKERRLSLSLAESERSTANFEALAPEFASRYGGRDLRWVNAVKLSAHGTANVAMVIPFNTFDWTWPRLDFLGEPVTIGTEGWVFAQRYKESTATIKFLTHENVIVGTLEKAGIEAKLSEPGHIARQMLNHLGGLYGVHLIADKETLRLLNAMAGGLRRRQAGGVEAEEEFDRRSKPLEEWQRLVARRNAANRVRSVSLEDFTRRNMIRLGIETACPHCQAANWHSLTAADYQLTCVRCLKPYAFPQAEIRSRNRNWAYRVIGPFSVPDFARGGYGALLALNVLGRIGGPHDPMTFSTALTMRFDDVNAEADFVALHASELMGRHQPPNLVVGEAKSLGDGDLINTKDLGKLKAIGAKLPGAFLVVAVMRDDFTPAERTALLAFVRWARRPNAVGEPTNPVLLLTGNELFHHFAISSTWKELGGWHAQYSDYHHTRDLMRFAESTQAIYLKLPLFHEDQRKAVGNRRAQKKAAAQGDNKQ